VHDDQRRRVGGREGGREGGRDVPAVKRATLGWKWMSATNGISYPRLKSSWREEEGGREGEREEGGWMMIVCLTY